MSQERPQSNCAFIFWVPDLEGQILTDVSVKFHRTFFDATKGGNSGHSFRDRTNEEPSVKIKFALCVPICHTVGSSPNQAVVFHYSRYHTSFARQNTILVNDLVCRPLVAP